VIELNEKTTKMNKTNLIIKVSELSGVGSKECETVLDAFEKVFSNELSTSAGVGNAFDKVYKIMDFLKKRKDNIN